MNFVNATRKIVSSHLIKQRFQVCQKRCLFRKGTTILIGIASVVPAVQSVQDVSINTDTQDVSRNEGWERVKKMFSTDEYGQLSKELTATIHSSCCAILAGFIYGGVKSGRVAYRDFLERNQATIFDNHLDAKRRLQNHVSIHFGKGAFHWAVKIGIFTGGFMLFLTTMATYRGSSSIIDYAASGTVVGGLVRCRIGPAATVVGAAVGGVLGLLSGLTTKGFFYLGGYSLDDVLSYQYEFDQNRKQMLRDALAKETAKYIDKETTALIKAHDDTTAETPK